MSKAPLKTTQSGYRTSTDFASKGIVSSRHHKSRRSSAHGTVSDYEDVFQAHQTRQKSILKKQRYYDDDYIAKKKHQAPIYNPSSALHKGQKKPNASKSHTRHATFHQSTADSKRSHRHHGKPVNRQGSSLSHLKTIAEWKKSVAHLLDKSQLSAVDRFRRRNIAFRTAVFIGVILATAAALLAIMGTVYYLRVHKLPAVEPKVTVLASINGTVRLLDMTYNDILKIRDSDAFRDLEKAICQTIQEAVSNSTHCYVDHFRNGSIIADFAFKVNLPDLTDVDQADPSVHHAPNRREEIMANVTSKRLSKLGHKFNLNIDAKFGREPEVDLFMTEIHTKKVVRIDDVQPIADNKKSEIICSENTTLTTANYFADPTDCRRFLVCDGTQLYRLTCGNGTAWNAEDLTCDFKSNTNCTIEWNSTSIVQSDFGGEDEELPIEVIEPVSIEAILNPGTGALVNRNDNGLIKDLPPALPTKATFGLANDRRRNQISYNRSNRNNKRDKTTRSPAKKKETDFGGKQKGPHYVDDEFAALENELENELAEEGLPEERMWYNGYEYVDYNYNPTNNRYSRGRVAPAGRYSEVEENSIVRLQPPSPFLGSMEDNAQRRGGSRMRQSRRPRGNGRSSDGLRKRSRDFIGDIPEAENDRLPNIGYRPPASEAATDTLPLRAARPRRLSSKQDRYSNDRNQKPDLRRRPDGSMEESEPYRLRSRSLRRKRSRPASFRP